MGEVETGSDTVIRVLTFALNQKNEILRGKNEAREPPHKLKNKSSKNKKVSRRRR